MLPEMDTVSLAEFKRKDPAGEGATGPSFANPLLSQTWIWEEGEYVENAPGVPECEEDECDEWRDLLPDAPRDIELISSIGLGRVRVSDINDVDIFIPQKHIDWSSLDNLRTGNREEVGHTLAKHPNRRNPSPEEISSTLNIAFSLAREAEDIVPVDEVDMDELPVNATYSDHDSGVPISLTVIKTPSETQWRERIRWINDWYRLQQAEDDDSQRPPFKPVTARMNSTGEYKIKQLPEYEKVDGGPPKPEQVDPTGGIGGGEL
jgi:hypothetical protein